MVRRTTWVCSVMVIVLAVPASAASWDSPSILARLMAVSDSELFPGSGLSDSDESLQLGVELETGRRLSKHTKLGLQLEASGSKYQRFSEADFGRLGLMSSLRGGATTVTIGGEWTPRRLKFPGTLDDGGVFARQELHLGLRRNLGGSFRARIEGRLRSDDYKSPFDVRDSDSRELYGQLAVRASAAVTLRVEGATAHSQANSRKYTQDEHWASLGATWANQAWRVEAAVISGIDRYPDALPSDSNHRRRDQTLETSARVTRAIGSGWSVLLGGQQFEQISTRPERTYKTHSVRLGVEWARAAR